MIAKITRGARVGDLAAYLHGPGRANEHVYDGRVGGAVVGGNLGREGERDGTGWAIDLREAASNRPDVAKPIWHMSVRCAPQDRRLSDTEWAEAALEMGERMGWAQHPWVVVRHADDHVHIAVSRVGHDGKLWYGKNDAREAQRARGPVEARLGLVATPIRSTPESKRVADHRLKHGEHARGARTGQVPERVMLAVAVRGAVKAGRGLGREVFEGTLRAAGVEFRVNEASTGRVSGYSVHMPGHEDADGQPVWFKTSQLDRELSWNRIKERLERPVEDRYVPQGEQRKMLESQSRFEQRREQSAVQAKQRFVRSLWPSFAQDLQKAAPHGFWKDRQQQWRSVAGSREERQQQEANRARIVVWEAEQERRRAAGLAPQVFDRRDLANRPQMTDRDRANLAGLQASYGMTRSESLEHVAGGPGGERERPEMTQRDRENVERLRSGYGTSRQESVRRAKARGSQSPSPPPQTQQRDSGRDYGR